MRNGLAGDQSKRGESGDPRYRAPMRIVFTIHILITTS